ncbi:MAG: nitrogenase molybdenum-iron protein subunit beta [Deltaproteobacteria bacterium]|jgi:nitrogenase molybdenum-iron protein beta chain|nr:nitrogenase molybdenum-iron protein subunit beta [Deltaproteobacteria bacterium]
MLDQTPSEYLERKALRINPLKTCQPVGALYAALGVRKCMPHSHGSQGCVSYHRSFLTRHFKEPAIATSSSFTEGASVFGGGANLKASIKNIFDIYDPDIIAVHTTCLSETIGDDLNAFISEATVPEGKLVVYANTPSYVGSHITGFGNMVASFIKQLSIPTSAKCDKIGLLPGWVNPGDIRELKRLLSLMGLEAIILPDQSGVLDSPMTGTYQMYPEGGTTIEDIIALGSVKAAISLGYACSTEASLAIKGRLNIETSLMPLPIGVRATDNFLMSLSSLSGQKVPLDLESERGRLIDLMLDANQYFHEKKVAIFGDPDTVEGLCAFCLELGLKPLYVLTGTPGDSFVERVKKILRSYQETYEVKIKAAGDLFELHQWIKNQGVDLLLGSSYGKQIAKAQDTPMVRVGFPVLDRYGHAYNPIVGYRGAIRLAEMIASTLMDRLDRDCADEDLDVVM